MAPTIPASDEVDDDVGGGGVPGVTMVGWVAGALADGGGFGGGRLAAAPTADTTGAATTATVVDMPTLANAADTTEGDASAAEILAADGVVALAP
jgi:hypothetical protein